MKKTGHRQQPANRPGLHINDYGYDRTIHSLGRASRRKRLKARQIIMTALLVMAATAAIFWLASCLIGPGATDSSSQSDQPTSLTTSSSMSDPSATPETSTQTTATETTPEPAPSPQPTLDPAERQLQLDMAGESVVALLQQYKGRFAVFVMNLPGGETWRYQDDQPFVAASSIKLGINTRLYTQIAAGQISPDEMLTYDSRPYPTGDYEAGTGTIQGLASGTQLTVRETSGLSIRISDNCGTNMIIRRLGGIDAINPWLNDISGLVDYRKPVAYVNYAGQSQSGRHRTCAADLGQHAVALYRLWEQDPGLYEPLMDDLSRTEFDFGIQKGIPAGVRVAHKIGTNGIYSAENDVGIVFAPEPFVLCVMTEMASAAQAHAIQAEIAAIFYDCLAAWP